MYICQVFKQVYLEGPRTFAVLWWDIVPQWQADTAWDEYPTRTRDL